MASNARGDGVEMNGSRNKGGPYLTKHLTAGLTRSKDIFR